MSLPELTKFPCCMFGDEDSVSILWNVRSKIFLTSRENGKLAQVALDREQIQSLRDQLNEWLEVTK